MRKEAAAYLGIDPVEPVPLARVRPSQLLMLAVTFFGLWLLVQQFVGFGEIVPVLADASWWWVAATLVITQTTAISEAVAMSGAVPGGMGVVEASYISLLTLLGIPEDLAIATTLLYRLCTTYLPPIWGWGALVWLRRHDEL